METGDPAAHHTWHLLAPGSQTACCLPWLKVSVARRYALTFPRTAEPGLASSGVKVSDDLRHAQIGKEATMRARATCLVLLPLMLNAGCAGGEPGSTETRVELGQEFKLRDRHAAYVGHDGLELRFERVTEDARCPVGNTCVSAGDAVALVTLRQPPNAPASLALHTDPSSTPEGRYLGYRVRLVRLEPRPVGEQYVPLPQYWATFMVSR